jgi:outer membrane protein TolC
MLGGCAALQPFEHAPPSPERPWKSPDLAHYSDALAEREHAAETGAVPVEATRTYSLSELIDIAQRTNPATRVAWERARQAALAIGLAEGAYYPLLAASATGAVAQASVPIPTTVIPGGVFTAKTHFVIPVLSLEWLVLDFGGRRALVDAAKAQSVEAAAGFNATHQKIVFEVTRDFYSLTAARGKVSAARAALESARSLEDAAGMRKQHGLATLPESLQAQEEVARSSYDLEDALAAERDARMVLVESIGIRPDTPIEIADVSGEPMPTALEQSVDEAIDRALTQRPDLIASLARVRAGQAEVRKAHSDFWPRLVTRAALSGNIGQLKVEDSAYQGVDAVQYDAGFRLEWPLFDGFERRNKLSLARSRQVQAEGELDDARDKAVREVWKAYDDVKVSLAKQRASAALLIASDKAWAATSESYKDGLATYPDVREAERNLARARTLDQAARAEAMTRAVAFAFSTGDLAKP